MYAVYFFKLNKAIRDTKMGECTVLNDFEMTTCSVKNYITLRNDWLLLLIILLPRLRDAYLGN